MDETIVYHCGQCNREFTRTLANLQMLFQKKRMACQFCGGALVLPEGLDFSKAPTAQAGLLEKKFNVFCPTCDRPRQNELDLKTILKCKWCGMSFRSPPNQGEPSITGPVAEGDLISMEEIQSKKRFANTHPLTPVFSNALKARADRKELLRSEFESLYQSWEGLGSWNYQPTPFLPLIETEASHVVPYLLFGSSQFFVENKGTHSLLTIILKEEDASGGSGMMKEHFASNVIGLTSLALTGSGFMVSSNPDDDTQQSVQHRIQVILEPVSNGVSMRAAYQINDEKPQPFSGEESERLALSTFQLKETIENYYLLLALFGAWAQGLPAINAVRDSIRKRLQIFGYQNQTEVENIVNHLQQNKGT